MTDGPFDNVPITVAGNEYPNTASMLGDRGKDVQLAQAYLRRVSYLPNEDLARALARNPVVGRKADGRLEAFVKGKDAALRRIWHNLPYSGWS